MHFAAEVLGKLQPYVPLMQSLVWPTFLGILIVVFRRQFLDFIDAVKGRIRTGSSLKAGPLEIGEDLRQLDYAAPRQSAPRNVGPEEPQDWISERTGIYADNHGLFLTHVLTLSQMPGQKYDVFIYLIRHKTEDMSDVVKAEFFFGHMWGNEVFTEKPKDDKVGISTSAYGPFLCTCRVHLNGGAMVKLHRYIDFEMARVMAGHEGEP